MDSRPLSNISREESQRLETAKRNHVKRIWVKMLIIIGILVFLWLAAIGTVWAVSAVYNRGEVYPDTDAIIVLGAQVLPNRQPNRILKTRLDMAVRAYAAAPRTIICCGAQGSDEPAPEGEVMRGYLIERGIPENDVIAETDSYNTYENIGNAARLLGTEKKTVLIVTSDYHIPRALWIARDKGLTAYGAGSPTYWKWRFKNHTKEALSWLKYAYMKITGKV